MKAVIYILFMILSINVVFALSDYDLLPNDFVTAKVKDLPTWRIIKSGYEEDLDVEVRNLDIGSAVVIVKTNDRYKNNIIGSTSQSQLRNIPITKLNGSGYTISKNNLSLDKDDYFYINYDNLNNFSIKIGLESVVIYVGTCNMYPVTNDNGIIDYNWTMHVTWLELDDDIYYAKSNDYGESWDYQLLQEGLYTTVGIVQNSSTKMIYFVNATGIGALFSDYGDSFYIKTLHSETAGNILDLISCIDSPDDVIHCCFINDSFDTLYYLNSTDWSELIPINEDTIDDSDICDIAYTDRLFISSVGTDGDDVDLWDSNVGYGSLNRITVMDNTTFIVTGYDMRKTNDNGLIFAAEDSSSDVWFSTNSSNALDEFLSNAKEVYPSGAAQRPIVKVTNENVIYILTTAVIMNSTDNGETFYTNAANHGGDHSYFDNTIHSRLDYLNNYITGDITYAYHRVDDNSSPIFIYLYSLYAEPMCTQEPYYLGGYEASNFNVRINEPAVCSLSYNYTDALSYVYFYPLNKVNMTNYMYNITNTTGNMTLLCLDWGGNYFEGNYSYNNSFITGVVKDDNDNEIENAFVIGFTNISYKVNYFYEPNNNNSFKEFYFNTAITNSTGQFKIIIPNGTNTVCSYNPSNYSLRGDCISSIEVSYG